ncbi:hypothetical protein [Ideonella sp. B508-1]|uniref:hypothetical protein n=1 Tax=Ideonella sp. B508-1 TaxID=137716 RepID=UPI0003B4902F|nr:hypothetical protein [Ideonella sp. B508-1]
MESPRDVAAIRLDNALLLFDEFVQATVKNADAAALRGLERRFAERLQIQPSYWSQIKGRSRQIGERLARQFEQNCRKPAGWMDEPHGASATAAPADAQAESPLPRDDDERFIVGLVLTYYRRHPQRARTRLLDLLSEVLVPAPTAAGASPVPPPPGVLRPAAVPAPAPASDKDLWRQSQRGVAPLKGKR